MKEQEGTCKMLTTKTTIIGRRLLNGLQRKCSSILEDSEVTKVSTRELKERAQSPNESSVNIVRMARQARYEKGNKLIAIFRQEDNEVVRTIERLGTAGEALPGAQGGSGAFQRRTRSSGRSDGE